MELKERIDRLGREMTEVEMRGEELTMRQAADALGIERHESGPALRQIWPLVKTALLVRTAERKK